MKLIKKLDNLFSFCIGQIKMSYFKILLVNNFEVGSKPQIKFTSRINIWDKKGKIVIGDFFSMGYNSEVYSWDDELIIGSNTSINDNCKIYGKINIGSNCLFASNIFVSSGTHNFSSDKYLPIKVQDKLKVIVKPVTIEDDCWIGFGVVIMPGVHVGKGAIIGSNAVVTKNVFPYSINAGIPSREIGKRLLFGNLFEEINCKTPDHWPYFYKGINYNQFDNVTSVKEGIEIVNPISVFLLSKKNVEKLRIKGFSEAVASFNFFVNKSQFKEIEIKDGFFDINLNLIQQNENWSKEFDNISKEIKDLFNVITIETDLKIKNKSDRKVNWKIISIGYYEN